MSTRTKSPVGDNGRAETDFPTNRLPTDPEAPSVAAEPELDPFDEKRLLLAQADPTAAGVEEKRYDVKYRKPPSDAFFMVHSDPAYTITIGTLELTGRDEAFFVDPSLWAALAGEKHFSYRRLHCCVTVAGDVFLWGLRIPDPDKKEQQWVKIPWCAAEDAKSGWVRLYWDESQRKHRVKVAKSQHSVPQWPRESLKELMKLAFSDSLIMSLDHPVLRRLRGEN